MTTEDDALFASLRDTLFTAVVGDVLDKLGFRRQFLPQGTGMGAREAFDTFGVL